MQYNFINMVEIENGEKLSISKTLAKCKDLNLFEQESVQVIIDYKWSTHAFHYFRKKFMLYLVFMVTFFSDNEIDKMKEEGKVLDDFYMNLVRKSICISV